MGKDHVWGLGWAQGLRTYPQTYCLRVELRGHEDADGPTITHPQPIRVKARQTSAHHLSAMKELTFWEVRADMPLLLAERFI